MWIFVNSYCYRANTQWAEGSFFAEKSSVHRFTGLKTYQYVGLCAVPVQMNNVREHKVSAESIQT